MNTPFIPAVERPELPRRAMLRQSAAWLGAGLLGAQAAAAEAPSPKSNAFRLDGKAALVTGAARGIGRAIAAALAEAGADIMGLDIAGPVSQGSTVRPATEEELHETGRLVEAQQRKFVPVKADVRDLPALRAAAARARETLGTIEIVVANAGIQIFSPLAEASDFAWHDVLDVNLTGAANTVRAFLPSLLEKGRGRIIFIASGQGRHGMKNGASYAASKWGLIGLMKSLALELGPHRITVNSVEPGLVDTPLTRNKERWNEALKQNGRPPEIEPKEEDVKAALLVRAPMKVPWLQPEDIAPAVVFLASDAAAWVSGATYDVTGGDSANYTA